MAKYLAIDFDRHEVRCLWAAGSRGNLKVVGAVRTPIVAESGVPQPADAQAALRNAMAGHGHAGLTVLLAADRASIDMVSVTVPPAKDTELFDIVLNLAMRESPQINDEFLLDYQVQGDDARVPRQVTAAAISPERLNRLKDFCAAAKCKPRRVVLRTYATASLFTRGAPAAQPNCVVVNLINDEADLIVFSNRKARYLRTVRLPGPANEPKSTDRLLAEIQRTLAVAAEDRPDAPEPEAVYVYAGPAEHAPLVERLREELGLPADSLDPFLSFDAEAEGLPADRGCFAPLLGMVQDEAADSHAFDLLRPPRRAVPADRRRPVFLALAGVLLLSLIGAYFVWDQTEAADQENRELGTRLSDLKSMLKKSGEQKKVVDAVHTWEKTDITWLDELRDLSLRFPTGRDMMLFNMSMKTAGKAGGNIDFKGVVRDQRVLLKLEKDIRDDYHEVKSKHVQERRERWLFETQMSVEQRKKSEYTSHLPQEEEKPKETDKPAKDSKPEPKSDK